MVYSLRRQRRLDEETPAYERRKSILSQSERNFYTVLQQVVGDRGRIFLKVRLFDLVSIPEVTSKMNAHLRRSQRRCVDFVLCNPSTLAPMVAINLDDRELRKKRGLKKDEVVEDVMAIAGIPVLTIRMKKTYNPVELSHKVRLAITAGKGGDDTEDDGHFSGTGLSMSEAPTEKLKRIAFGWISDLRKTGTRSPRIDH